MHDRPTLHEILAVVGGFLEEDIVATTSGRTQFLARVAANLLRQAERELAREQEHAERTWSQLDALLGAQAAPVGRDDRRAAMLLRLESLCERIRAGELDPGASDHAALTALLRTLVRAKLEVSNPALLAADAERGIV